MITEICFGVAIAALGYLSHMAFSLISGRKRGFHGKNQIIKDNDWLKNEWKSKS